jgi:hypothetical protein
MRWGHVRWRWPRAGCGSPVSDELLPLPTSTRPEEASDLIRWFLEHDGPREAMADAAREAIQDRTFTNAAKRLLGLLDRAPINR